MLTSVYSTFELTYYSVHFRVIIFFSFGNYHPFAVVVVFAECQGRRVALVATEALQQTRLLQPVPQHAHGPRQAGTQLHL